MILNRYFRGTFRKKLRPENMGNLVLCNTLHRNTVLRNAIFSNNILRNTACSVRIQIGQIVLWGCVYFSCPVFRLFRIRDRDRYPEGIAVEVTGSSVENIRNSMCQPQTGLLP